MPLIEAKPQTQDPDPSSRLTLDFQSQADGRSMQADIYAPAEIYEERLPVVLAPHPITWTCQEDYHGGLAGLMRGYHKGWYGLADQYRVLIIMPYGHHRQVELCSLASPGQISDMVQLLDLVSASGYRIDRQRVYACGLSMGAQEALVLAGKHPDLLAAVVVFNPIVDLAVWQEELAHTEVEEIREFDTAGKIAQEVGGLPDEVPDRYAERSPLAYCDGLSRVPTMLYWSHEDLIVPHQETHHALLLYQSVKEISRRAPIAEYNHTYAHGKLEFTKQTRWQLHEWCDYELALKWLLFHQRGGDPRG